MLNEPKNGSMVNGEPSINSKLNKINIKINIMVSLLGELKLWSLLRMLPLKGDGLVLLGHKHKNKQVRALVT